MVKTADGLEKMVGYVFLWDTDKLLPWLGIAVREEWKGHQLGRRLINWIDSWAKPKGYGGVMLTSVPANIRAHSLYVRMGYHYFGTYPDSEFLYIKRYSKGKA
jgi:GNAT superfamily N-acetyltransferase